jgi:diguanylate cyclase (GGDEF)-like protein
MSVCASCDEGCSSPGGGKVIDRRDPEEIKIEWETARQRARRTTSLSAAAAIGLAAVLSAIGLILGDQIASAWVRYAIWAALLILVATPSTVLMSRRVADDQQKSDDIVVALARELREALEEGRAEASRLETLIRRQTFERRLANALEMAEGEPEVLDVIERSFHSVLPDAPVELLLADNSHAHLVRMATASPTGTPPSCAVDSPDHCPAARRAQVQHFASSEELDACPKLHGRSEGAISAVCVPVSIMGRTVGVIHSTGEEQLGPSEDAVEDLEVMAKLAGARIGLLRVMKETELQASTDNLTGLLNRRSFEHHASRLRNEGTPLSVAIGDLDHFKNLNDTYGHETGDRCLRLFAQVLSESVRAQDLVCRYGGEEFVIALPGCLAERVSQLMDSVNVRLQAAVAVAGLPSFTVSIGIVEVESGEDLVAAISRSDAALFEAKREGRNQVVVHDRSGRRVAMQNEQAAAQRAAQLQGRRHDDSIDEVGRLEG